MHLSVDSCRTVTNEWPTYEGPRFAVLGLGVVQATFIFILLIIQYKKRKTVAEMEYTLSNSIAAQPGLSAKSIGMSTQSLILPFHTWLLTACAFAILIQACARIFITGNIYKQNTFSTSILFATSSFVFHFVYEGLVFLLMCKGVGTHAYRVSAFFATLWGLFTFALFFYIAYESYEPYGFLFELVWQSLLFVFYACLWLLPYRIMYRRPSALPLAVFMTIVQSCRVTAVWMRRENMNAGYCFYLVDAFLITLFYPFVLYRALLLDSRYWQGLLSYGRVNSKRLEASIRSPLLGVVNLARDSAASIARQVDQISRHSFAPLRGSIQGGRSINGIRSVSDADATYLEASMHVPVLNFASLTIDQTQRHTVGRSSVGSASPDLKNKRVVVLGAGGTSRVYRGHWKQRECAIKLIYTTDLTPEVIDNFCSEATLLKSLAHPNIIDIYGVCVLPPSICLVMELCKYGSLYSFLQNPITGIPTSLGTSSQSMFFENKYSFPFKLRLAKECCAAIAFLHRLQPSIIHNDIKSHNFLVTGNLHIKLTDFELCRRGDCPSNVPWQVPQPYNWVAPELLFDVCENPPLSLRQLQYQSLFTLPPAGSTHVDIFAAKSTIAIDKKAANTIEDLNNSFETAVSGSIDSVGSPSQRMSINNTVPLTPEEMLQSSSSHQLQRESRDDKSRLSSSQSVWMRPNFGSSVPTIYSDVYSLGMVIWEIMAQQVPFSHLSISEWWQNRSTEYCSYKLARYICQGRRPRVKDDSDLVIPEDILSLIHRSWLGEPTDRVLVHIMYDELDKLQAQYEQSSSMMSIGDDSASVGTDGDSNSNEQRTKRMSKEMYFASMSQKQRAKSLLENDDNEDFM